VCEVEVFVLVTLLFFFSAHIHTNTIQLNLKQVPNAYVAEDGLSESEKLARLYSGNRVEVKNMNSVKNIVIAAQYEVSCLLSYTIKKDCMCLYLCFISFIQVVVLVVGPHMRVTSSSHYIEDICYICMNLLLLLFFAFFFIKGRSSKSTVAQG
jgi:hypothetical protein